MSLFYFVAALAGGIHYFKNVDGSAVEDYALGAADQEGRPTTGLELEWG